MSRAKPTTFRARSGRGRAPDGGSDEARRRLPAAERRELIERAATEVFAERGYEGASIAEIARRAGVTPPIIYDHFSNKLDLHRRLLERARDEMLGMWRANLDPNAKPADSVPAAIDAWARLVERNPYTQRMFFREASGSREAERVHLEVRREATGALAEIIGEQVGVPYRAGTDEGDALEMATEILRGGLTSLAVWWGEHPEVSREQVVGIALSTFWIGLERMMSGDAGSVVSSALSGQEPESVRE